jgi:ABC-2 type transport system permease protein
MINVLRSELVRLGRRGLLLGWMGLTALFAVLINVAMFQIVSEGDGAATDGPGTAFPSLAELTSADGLVSGLSSAASFFGVVMLAFWAISAASDYTTGLIRLLASAQPRRWKLLAGKVGALMLWTAAATTLALVVTTVVAPIGADAAGVSTELWETGAAGTLARAWIDLYAALLVWGTIGLVLATVTRSSSIAIACGVGYVLIVESVVRAAVSGLGDWLPGQTLTALAQGGTDTVSYTAALGLGAAYLVGGLALAAVVTTRRDITD